MTEAIEGEQLEDLPVRATLVPFRDVAYGVIEGVEEGELAEPEELERVALAQEWAPVLLLPRKGTRNHVVGDVTAVMPVRFGSFATVAFGDDGEQRMRGR